MKTINLIAALSIFFCADAAAKWTNMSDSWCRKHGFTPKCEVWTRAAKADKGDASAARGAPQRLPRAGMTIFDRWGNRIRADAEPEEGDVLAPGFDKGTATNR
ncbi:hypothetical protein [Massilia glaciei]|uniref:Uncharacterized protein n=1 Tax=Massilia glaciei TaxID=1524097 RepID=A0A2U2HNF4_9BURK|nr:hypothetical protein [Massilia glaciei]PWF48992.1 hypothetical protein C7C56_008885 [Massilia glaciei]